MSVRQLSVPFLMMLVSLPAAIGVMAQPAPFDPSGVPPTGGPPTHPPSIGIPPVGGSLIPGPPPPPGVSPSAGWQQPPYGGIEPDPRMGPGRVPPFGPRMGFGPGPPFGPQPYGPGPPYGPADQSARERARFEKVAELACRRIVQMQKNPSMLSSFELLASKQPAILWDEGLRRLMMVAALPMDKMPLDYAPGLTKENVLAARQEINKVGVIALLRDKPFRRAVLRLTWRFKLFNQLDRFKGEAQWYFRQHQEGARGQGCIDSLKLLAKALEMYVTDHPKATVSWTGAPQAQDPLLKGGYLKTSIEVCVQDGQPLRLARDPKSSKWAVRCETHGTPETPKPRASARDPKLEESNPIVWATLQLVGPKR